MLDALHKRYPFAVVSARNSVTVEKFLRVNDLHSYFDIVISSQTCEKTKPFPEPLLFAASELGVPIENCLMIGDTLTDVRAALAAGAQSLSVLCGFGTEKSCAKVARIIFCIAPANWRPYSTNKILASRYLPEVFPGN